MEWSTQIDLSNKGTLCDGDGGMQARERIICLVINDAGIQSKIEVKMDLVYVYIYIYVTR